MIVLLPSMLPRPDRKRHHAPDIFGSDIVSYASTYTNAEAGMPQIILVEVPEPGATLRAHYHASDQFQLVMDGNGSLGAHALNPVSLHYTNRYTGYGPIVAGDQGLAYYVLRPGFDSLGLGQYLHHPELREKLKQYPGRKRSFMKDGLRLRQPQELQAEPGLQVERLFGVADQEPDAGLFADELCLGPDRDFTCPEPSTGGGQVFFVLQGSVQFQGQLFGTRSAIAVTRDEAPITLTAGAQGLQALLMQYPGW